MWYNDAMVNVCTLLYEYHSPLRYHPVVRTGTRPCTAESVLPVLVRSVLVRSNSITHDCSARLHQWLFLSSLGTDDAVEKR